MQICLRVPQVQADNPPRVPAAEPEDEVEGPVHQEGSRAPQNHAAVYIQAQGLSILAQEEKEIHQKSGQLGEGSPGLLYARSGG